MDNVYIRDVATVKDGADIQAMPLLTENVPYISILQKQVMDVMCIQGIKMIPL